MSNPNPVAKQPKLPTWKELAELPEGFKRTRSTCCSVAIVTKNAAIPFMTCSRCGRLLQEYYELRDFPRTPQEIVLANFMILYPLDQWRAGGLYSIEKLPDLPALPPAPKPKPGDTGVGWQMGMKQPPREKKKRLKKGDTEGII